MELLSFLFKPALIVGNKGCLTRVNSTPWSCFNDLLRPAVRISSQNSDEVGTDLVLFSRQSDFRVDTSGAA